MPKRVLITGACGFAGAHLVEHVLATTDWEIVALDGLTYAGDVGRLIDAGVGDQSDRVTLLWHDLRSPIAPALDARIGEVDYVLHLAANSHVDRSIDEPRSFVEANVAITLTVLDWVRARNDRVSGRWSESSRRIAHLVQISTDEVYGAAPIGYSHREWDAVIPSNPYSASKAAQEATAIAYWRTYGVPVTITNTMNLVGERQDTEKFVAKVIKAVLSGAVVPIHAGRVSGPSASRVDPAAYYCDEFGRWWRPGSRIWLHARNHADALVWLLKNQPPGKYEPADLFPGVDRPNRWNVAGQVEVDNFAMARRIAGLLGRELRFEFVDFHSTRPGHDLRYSLDGSKLAAAGWTPPVPFDEALERTVRWAAANPEWMR